MKLYRQSHFSDAAGSELDGTNLCDHEPHTQFQSRDESSPDKLSRYQGKQASLSCDNTLIYSVIMGKRAIIP